MKLLIKFSLIFLSFSVFAQNPWMDSLKVVAETGSLDDQVRAKVELALSYRGQGQYDLFEEELYSAIKIGNQAENRAPLIRALLTRGWTYSYPPKVDLDSSLHYIHEGRKLAEALDHRYGRAESFYELGYHFSYFKNEFKDSIDIYFRKAIELLDETIPREETMILDAYKNLAFFHNRIGNVEKALSYVDSAETYRVDPHIMNVRAIIYDNTGQYARAVDVYLQSLALALSNNDTATINGTYNNIAAAYGNQGNDNKAKEYFIKSWNLTKLNLETARGFDVVQILRNVGMVYSALDNADSAEYFFRKAINEGEARQVIDPMYAPYFGMGELMYADGKQDSAMWYLNKSRDYSEQTNEYRVRSSATVALGDIAFDKKKYQSALSYYNEALGYAKGADNVKAITSAYEGIYKVQNKLGNYKAALNAHVQLKSFADSIYNTSNIEKISELEAKFLYDQEKQKLVADQEKETLILEGEVQRQRDLQVMYLAISGAFVLLFILAVYSYRRKNRDNKIIQEKSNELAQSNKDLKDLSEFKQGMTSMIAHDIKNPLNSIIGLSGKLEKKIGADISRAGEAVLRLITNMLDVEKFEQTNPILNFEKVLISDLIKEAHLSVELLLHDKSIKLESDISEDVYLRVDQDLMIRVLVNLLSNAIKFSPSNETITFSAVVNEQQGAQQVLLSVSDKGIGIPKDDQQYLFEKFYQSEAKKSGMAPSTGLGLTFCKMVAEAHGGKISVSSDKGQGSTFTIALDVEELAGKALVMEEAVQELITESDLGVLKSYSGQLKDLKVYNVGAIMPILDEIDKLGLQGDWAEQLRSAVQYANKDQYQQLVEMLE
ncbi:tetratricopeptide repeat-containing sensor histidine kinase [Ekhidna sp.]